MASQQNQPGSRSGSYQHTIPRFILKYFQSTPPLSRKQVNIQKSKTRKDPRKLHVFNLATGVLDELSFDDAYGVHNLYRNYKNLNNIDEVEQKLDRLVEQPSVELIRSIHADIEAGRDVVISRQKLERLRKFIFIMFFRKVSVSHHFFDVKHPDNAAAPQWIEEFAKAVEKRGGGFSAAVDMWQHALAYIIDTPHNDLIKRGTDFVFGSTQADHIKDPYGIISNSYATLGGCYYLQMWRASPGREFILTDNNLGLFEGLANFFEISSGPFSPPETLSLGLHRLFVVSPTIAFVLRLNDEVINMIAQGRERIINSNLDNIPKIFPISKNMNMPLDEKIHQYRAGVGQNDEFTFKITTLTPKQTDNVNFVLLREVKKKDGFLSFKTPKLCGELLERYWNQTYFADVEERPKLKALYSKLVPTKSPGTTSYHPTSVQTSSLSTKSSESKSTSESLPSKKSDIATSLPGLKGKLRF